MRIKPLSPLWLERAADIVEVEGIKQYSFGEWPHTRLLFEHVVNKHCLLLGIVSGLPKPGLFWDEILMVRDVRDEIQMLRVGMHELAERLIVAGHFPAINCYGDATVPHKIADIVADRYARFLRFVWAGRESEAFMRARDDSKRAAPKPPERYERDEYCDPPNIRRRRGRGT